MEVSVIIPVYNAEKNLRRCVDSVLNQSFADCEVLLIDDGSTDGSGALCDAYARRYARVRALHKQNGGVSSACNLGVENARGKYLMFCDSDDYAEPDWIETLHMWAQRHPHAFVFSAFFETDGGGDRTVRLEGFPDGAQIPVADYYAICRHNFCAYRWNRIYRRDIITADRLCFDTRVSVGEDVLFNIEYLKRCDAYLYADKPLYHWVNHGNDSLSRAYHATFYDDLKTLYFPRLGVIAEKDVEAYCTNALNRFFQAIEAVYDRRNTMTAREKKAYLQYILHDAAFCHALSHAKPSRLKALLQWKSPALIRTVNAVYRRIKRDKL